MLNYYYNDTITGFVNKSREAIIGEISSNGRLGHKTPELLAWEGQIDILKNVLQGFDGSIYFEFSIPRMGKRVDCILIIKNIIFLLEFKVGEKEYLMHDIEQVWDYALDLKNFHRPCHSPIMIPILVATKAKAIPIEITTTSHSDNLYNPLRCSAINIGDVIEIALKQFPMKDDAINVQEFITGSYSPTPTIIEAAVSLYKTHKVEEITRSDADVTNLRVTTKFISETIDHAKSENKKIICFVTGVPGAGKTLVGLKIAAEHLDPKKGNSSVFLSGNKPLVDILQEALTRDKVTQMKTTGIKITKAKAKEGVKAFIQIVHHYRDEYVRDPKAPYDHIAIFDEAQRAWTKEQTVKFMAQKKNNQNFQYSEPEFLISCLDRHEDWAVIICLVGGGQEINTGEAGISEWLKAIKARFHNWQTRISPNLIDHEYNAILPIRDLKETHKVHFNNALHLSVSMRSFRAEYVSLLVKQILDTDSDAANTLKVLKAKYPIAITRDINKAKKWLREKARGTERYGIVVSSQAYRLKPLAMDVKSPINHVHWFLNEKNDIRSSYFLEDAATEFQVQGLELDWTCVTWDADLRYSNDGWKHHTFMGNKWLQIRKDVRKKYLLNAYRVLLTRARQGMIIVIPEGNLEDHTRQPSFYDPTFDYLKNIGIEIV